MPHEAQLARQGARRHVPRTPWTCGARVDDTPIHKIPCAARTRRQVSEGPVPGCCRASGCLAGRRSSAARVTKVRVGLPEGEAIRIARDGVCRKRGLAAPLMVPVCTPSRRQGPPNGPDGAGAGWCRPHTDAEVGTARCRGRRGSLTSHRLLAVGTRYGASRSPARVTGARTGRRASASVRNGDIPDGARGCPPSWPCAAGRGQRTCLRRRPPCLFPYGASFCRVRSGDGGERAGGQKWRPAV